MLICVHKEKPSWTHWNLYGIINSHKSNNYTMNQKHSCYSISLLFSPLVIVLQSSIKFSRQTSVSKLLMLYCHIKHMIPNSKKKEKK